MLILGIDTATLTLSLALVERDPTGRDRILEQVTFPPPTPHSSLLPAQIEAMLGRAGHALEDLGAIVVGLGPGSFTGLRVGLSTARAMAFARQIPLVGASSLEAMARAVGQRRHLGAGALLVPLLDARKGEVYGGFFRIADQQIAIEVPEFVMPPEQLVERLRGEPRACLFGPGRSAYRALQALDGLGGAQRAGSSAAEPTPEAACLIASVHQIPPYSREAAFALEPHYVRPSDVEWKIPHARWPASAC